MNSDLNDIESNSINAASLFSEYSCNETTTTTTFNQKSISDISDIAHLLKKTSTRKKTADKNAILLL